MHKRGATFLAPVAFALLASTIVAIASHQQRTAGCRRHYAAAGALVNRLLKRYSPLQQDDSNLNFLSSFLMRALMHMRGSRFYSKLAAIALSYFFNAPRALISRPPNCENFQTTAGRPKVHSQPFDRLGEPPSWNQCHCRQVSTRLICVR